MEISGLSFLGLDSGYFRNESFRAGIVDISVLSYLGLG